MAVGEQANFIKDGGRIIPPKPVSAFNYSLNEESLAGFEMAVNNGQTRLALEYAARVLVELTDRVQALEAANTQMSSKSETSTASASNRKNRTSVEEKSDSSEV